MGQELMARNSRTPEIVAAEIRTFTASMLNNVIEIGRRLCEVKEMLPHGKFGAWIQENTGYSVSTANNFMKLYMEYGAMQGSLFGAEANSQTFGNLTYSKALALLAVPAEEREAFVTENNVGDMSTRELQDAIRERDAARLEAQSARADAEAAEEARQTMERQVKLQQRQREAAEERAEEAEHKLLGANDVIEKAEAEAAALRKEVKELKDRPVDVAVQRDEKAIEEARQEVRAEMQAKLNKAEKRASDAEEREKQVRLTHERNTADVAERAKKEAVAEMRAQLEKANAALDEANAAAKAASETESKLRQELSEARKAAERNAKEAAIGNNPIVSEFNAYFNQTQELVNKMNGLLLKLVQKDPDTAGRLGNALIALSDAIKKQAEKEAAV